MNERVAARDNEMKTSKDLNILQIADQLGIPYRNNQWPELLKVEKPISAVCSLLSEDLCQTKLGMYGFNTPVSLWTTMLDHFSTKQKVDVLFLNGNMVKSGEQQTIDQVVNGHKRIISDIKNSLQDVPILPTFGKDDLNLQGGQQYSELYSRLYDVWFSDSAVKPVQKSTFLDGGYYRFDFPESDISVLAMNSAIYGLESHDQNDAADRQLIWLEQNLKENNMLPENTKRKFVLAMNTYPGLEYKHTEFQYLGEDWQNWKANAIDRFQQIITAQNDQADGKNQNIVLYACAGSYKAQFRNTNVINNNFVKNKIPMMISPSISPLKSTNPSYMTYELSHQEQRPQLMGYDVPQWLKLGANEDKIGGKYQIENVEITSLQLQYNIIGSEENIYSVQRPSQDWNFDFNFNYTVGGEFMDQNSGVALDHTLETVRTIDQFGQFEGYRKGFDLYARNWIFGKLLLPFKTSAFEPYGVLWSLCMEKEFSVLDPHLAFCMSGANNAFKALFVKSQHMCLVQSNKSQQVDNFRKMLNTVRYMERLKN